MRQEGPCPAKWSPPVSAASSASMPIRRAAPPTSTPRSRPRRPGAPGTGLRDALVVGASTGYGLSSLVSAAFGYGARATGVCLERPPQGDKTASAGWYNLAAVQRRGGGARALGVGDQRRRVLGRDQARDAGAAGGGGGEARLFVYSLAAPKRTDAAGVSYASVLKPIGAPFRSKTISLGNDQVTEIEIAPANDAEIAATRKVMGGEDLGGVDERAARSGPAGARLPRRRVQLHRARADLPDLSIGDDRRRQGRPGGDRRGAVGDAEGARGRRRLRQRQQGAGDAGVVGDSRSCRCTSALLYKVMKAAGTHEGTAEQIARLLRDHLGARAHADDRRRRAHPHRRSRDGARRPGARGRAVGPGDEREPVPADRLRQLQARLSRAVRLRGSWGSTTRPRSKPTSACDRLERA